MHFKTLLFVFGAFALATLSAEEPLYKERFNDANGLDLINGAKLGPGLSGKPGDLAYQAAVPADPDKPSPAGIITSPIQMGDLTQVTLTLWYKSEGNLKDPDSLLHLGGLYLLWQTQRGLTLRAFTPPGGEPFADWFGSNLKGPAVSWSIAGEWIFYAITFDYDSQTVLVYQGTASESVQEANHLNNLQLTGPIKEGPAHVIGNNYEPKNNSGGKRPFEGSIDNVRIYGKILTSDQIEAIRKADLNNTEPVL